MGSHTGLEMSTRVDSEGEGGCCLVGGLGGRRQKSLPVQLVDTSAAQQRARCDAKVKTLSGDPSGLAVNWNNKVNTCGCQGTQSSFDLSPGQIN